jgi:hypothetical protein
VFERRSCLAQLLTILETEAQHVMRLVKYGIELDSVLQRGNRARQAAGGPRRERELVEHG